MKILLLGANGQLGRDLIAAAERRADAPEIVPLMRRDLDLTDLDAIRPTLHALDFDVVINATGQHRTDHVESEPGPAFTVNAHAVAHLAAACRERSAPFLHVSTDYVFDGSADQPYSEDAAPAPINVYGASKLMGEALARREWPEGTRVVRTASLFGLAGSSGKGGNFVETMIRVGTEKGRLRVVDDVVMSPTATADLARGILRLIDGNAPPGIYHLVNAGRATWYEFARTIIEIAGVDAAVEPVPSSEYPTPARRPAFSVLACGRAAAEGVEMPAWEDALERYVRAREESAASV